MTITDNTTGSVIGFNTVVTYTITFSEDIDLTSVSGADFDNAGTSTITIGTITETTSTSGVLLVPVTPTSGGTLQLRIPVGATISDVVGSLLLPPVLDAETFTVIEPTVASISPDTGTAGDFLTSNNGNITIAGRARALGQVSIIRDGSSVGSVFAGTNLGDGHGNYSFPDTLADGVYVYSVQDITTGAVSANFGTATSNSVPSSPTIS